MDPGPNLNLFLHIIDNHLLLLKGIEILAQQIREREHAQVYDKARKFAENSGSHKVFTYKHETERSILDFLFHHELVVCTVDLYGLIRAPLLNLHSHGLAS